MAEQRQDPRSVAPIETGRLAKILGGSPIGGSALIRDVVDDDRAPELDDEGTLFASRPSRRSLPDARSAARGALDRAIERGAAAVLVDDVADVGGLGVPAIVVDDVNVALGPAAAAVHGHPSRLLPMVLITGTDGKTTTTFMAASALQAGTRRGVGMLTTIHRLVGGQVEPSRLTTPEAADLQHQLRRMVDAGDGAAVMEASSIALLQGRLRGVEGVVGVFTNLTPEHLDLHPDLPSYFAAKELLFTEGYVSTAVINIDTDPGFQMAASARRSGLRVVEVSPSGERQTADLHVRERISPKRAWVSVHGTVVEIVTGLPGAHNLANALCALAAALELGADVHDAAAGIAALTSVPGRFEQVADPAGEIEAYVDYAHTPAALQVTVTAGREIAKSTGGRLLVTAGCGGARDPHKRAPMGRIVAEGADLAIFTSDNPRTEDPQAIVDAMIEGVPSGDRTRLLIEIDRRAAIVRAVEAARPGDVLIVAGKGHEAEQIGRNGSRPFDDRQVLAAALESRALGGPGPRAELQETEAR